MNSNLQPAAHFDSHPDAEILNAFAEQALREHERTPILAHLAVCSRCRQIVALAQEAAELEDVAPAQVPSAQPAVRSRPSWFRNWFRNWRVAWLPVAALVCLVTLTVVVNVRHFEKASGSAKSAPPAQQQAMTVQQQAATVPQARQAGVPAAPVPAGKRAISPRRHAPPSPQALAEAAFSAQPATVPAQEPASSAMPAPGAAAPLHGSLYSTEASAWRQQEARATTAQKRALPANEQPVWAAAGSAGAAPDRRLDMESPAPAPARPAGVAANAAVTSSPVFAPRLTPPAPLPSGLARVSTASIGRRMVAIDSAGAVFLSLDGGAHWEPVARQWSGQAVSVRVRISSAAPQSAPESSSLAAPQPAALQSDFVVENDKGEAWTSSDGRTWAPK